MRDTRISDCRFLKLKNFSDIKGRLDVIEGIQDMNHEIINFKRTYILREFNKSKVRGVHGHRNLYQLFLTFNGSFTLNIFDGYESKDIFLSDGSAFLIVPGIWRELSNFSLEPIIFVMASELYDPLDYIHDIKTFEDYKRN